MGRISRLNVGRLSANRADVTTVYANEKDITKAIAHNVTGGKKFVGGTTSVTGSATLASGLSTVEVVVANLGKAPVSGEGHRALGYPDSVAGNIVLKVYVTDAVGDVTESGVAQVVDYVAVGT